MAQAGNQLHSCGCWYYTTRETRPAAINLLQPRLQKVLGYASHAYQGILPVVDFHFQCQLSFSSWSSLFNGRNNQSHGQRAHVFAGSCWSLRGICVQDAQLKGAVYLAEICCVL
jgi:hypothetical protein